jgi:hypothetical protein
VAYEIQYYHVRVLAAIEAWPTDILADYARLAELLIEHGPNLRMPHSRSLGEVSSSFGRAVGKASVERCTASCLVVASPSYMRLSRRRRKRPSGS